MKLGITNWLWWVLAYAYVYATALSVSHQKLAFYQKWLNAASFKHYQSHLRQMILLFELSAPQSISNTFFFNIFKYKYISRIHKLKEKILLSTSMSTSGFSFKMEDLCIWHAVSTSNVMFCNVSFCSEISTAFPVIFLQTQANDANISLSACSWRKSSTCTSHYKSISQHPQNQQFHTAKMHTSTSN